MRPSIDLKNLREELARRLLRLAAIEGINQTALPELLVVRSLQPIARQEVVYKPCLCVVAQGRKRAHFGDRVITYDPDNYLAVSLQLPIQAEIIEASPERPFLAFVLEIDPAAVGQLLLDMGDARPESGSCDCGLAALETSEPTVPIIDSVLRLLRIIDDPMDCRILAPAAVREILYHVLADAQGESLRALAFSHTRLHRMSRVVRFIEQNYADRIDIASIAQNAGMSESNLHHTFKEVTSLSPIQYLKKVRLHHARLRLVNTGLGAGEVGYQVGYESASQFSREFKRLFGVPPSRAAETVAPTGGPGN